MSPCRTDSTVTVRANKNSSSCALHSLLEVAVGDARPDASAKIPGYILGFAEFDDEGKAWAPKQEQLIFDRMSREAATQDLSIIVFVHGWKHNAAETDDNVEAFQTLLRAITIAEQQPTDRQPRKVVGIYVSWRGETGPSGLLDNLTFWTRKDAAQRVAEGSVRGLLGKVRAFHDALNLPPSAPGRHGTRMLTIGHSFGGLIVYSALAQYFTDRAAASLINAEYFPNLAKPPPSLEATDDPRLIPSYGDLVILINPAIEAMRYEPIQELVVEQHAKHPGARSYAPMQTPVMVEVTSVGDGLFDGDWATGVAFEVGRVLPTRVEATTPDENLEVLQTIGHYERFWTHDLNISAADAASFPEKLNQVDLNQAIACENLADFESHQRVDGYLVPGWTRTFRGGTVLQQEKAGPSDPNNPFWIVRAHPRVIKDHDDILNPVLTSFVTQLSQDLYLLKDRRCENMTQSKRPEHDPHR